MKQQADTYTIPLNAKPQFLNRVAPSVFEYVASKSKANNMIANGELLVNGEQARADSRVFAGDVLTLKQHRGAKKAPSNKKVFEEKIDVVFEDEHMAILNKPGGMPVNGNQLKTLENALPYNLQASKERDALAVMRPIHRLDTPTCGLVLVAKTGRAQVAMGQQFENKTIRKRYKAVVIGRMDEHKGSIDSPIDGKPCLTEYEQIKSSKSGMYGTLTLLDLFPVTGRTHQLRIHMSEAGHPVVGDKYYSKETSVLDGKGLMLCSDKVVFQHPISNKPISIEIKIPNKFMKFMEREAHFKGKDSKPSRPGLSRKRNR